MLAFKPGSTDEYYKIQNEAKKNDYAFCKFISEFIFFKPVEKKEDKKNALLECRLGYLSR